MNIQTLITKEPEIGHLINIAKRNSHARSDIKYELWSRTLRPQIETCLYRNQETFNYFDLVIREMSKALKL